MNEIVPRTTIKEVRAKMGLTQKQFADITGVSPQTVSKWEKDITSISPKKLVLIYQKFGVKSSDLLGA